MKIKPAKAGFIFFISHLSKDNGNICRSYSRLWKREANATSQTHVSSCGCSQQIIHDWLWRSCTNRICTTRAGHESTWTYIHQPQPRRSCFRLARTYQHDGIIGANRRIAHIRAKGNTILSGPYHKYLLRRNRLQDSLSPRWHERVQNHIPGS